MSTAAKRDTGEDSPPPRASQSGRDCRIGSIPKSAHSDVVIGLGHYEGEARVDIRVWAKFRTEGYGHRGPTGKGVSLPITHLPTLILLLEEAQDLARERGLIP